MMRKSDSKMNKCQLFSLFAIMAFAFTACTPTTNEIEETLLEVSDHEVTCENTGSELTVQVSTNATKWVAFESTEWLSVAQSGNELKITVNPNSTVYGRSSSILISAGDKQEVINVNQKAGAVVISPELNEIKAMYGGGDFLVNINTNADDWKVDLPADATWIKVKRIGNSSVLSVTVEPNNGEMAREVIMKVGDNGSTQSISVKQEGVPEFFLPAMEVYDKGQFALIEYESRRGNKLLTREEVRNNYYRIIGYNLIFLTPSKNMGLITYNYGFEGDVFSDCTIECSNVDALFSDKLSVFMEDHNFKHAFDRNLSEGSVKRVYTKKEKNLNFRFEIKKYKTTDKIKSGRGLVHFIIRPQSEVDQIFKSVPYRKIDGVLFNKSFKRDQIIEFEKEKGGEIDEDEDDYITFVMNEPSTTRYMTYYGLVTEEDSEDYAGCVDLRIDQYTNYFLAARKLNDGTYDIAPEFVDLLEADGFLLDEEKPGYTYQYYNVKKNLECLLFINKPGDKVDIWLRFKLIESPEVKH